MVNGREKWRLPELLIGMLALAIAVAVTGVSVAGAVREIKRSRDTIDVTGSARQPISADVVHWSLAVSAEAPRPEAAVAMLKTRAAAVRSFLRRGGLPESAVTEPPVSTQQILIRVAARRRAPGFRVVQRFRIGSTDMDRIERVAAHATDLLAQGIPVSTGGLVYLSTNLADARVEALKGAVADAHRRAETIVAGIGGKLGSVKSAQIGVYQVVPRNSTSVSDYGIYDTTSREKDVYAVVSVTFRLG